MCNKLVRGVVVCVLGAAVAGCETKAGTGALIGGAGGAAAGGAIGSMSHGRAGEGALIGGAVGLIGGALVGNSMDQADKKRDREQFAEREYDRRSTPSASISSTVSKTDVVSWTQRGTRDEIIIDRIERSGSVFRLSVADENELRDRGVSESVIRAMRDTSRR